MAASTHLTWQDFLELAAALAGLARVRSCFLPFGTPKPTSNGSPAWVDAALPERIVALARAGLYNFLATTFAEPPSPAFVESVYESGALRILANKGLGGEGLRHWGEGMGPLGRAADLAAAYTQLLTRPGPNYIPPIASAYLCSDTDRAQTLSWGPAAEAVEAAYREAGLVVGGNGSYPPDHLGVELQFMQHCAAREAAAWGEGDWRAAAVWRWRQWAFLSTHLLPWASAFGERVNASGAHPYYRTLVSLTAGCLAADAQNLTETLTTRTAAETVVLERAS